MDWSIPIHTLMNPSPLAVRPDAPATEAWALHLAGLRHVPVVEDGRPVGLVTPLDLATVATDPDALTRLTVRDLMTTTLVTVSRDATAGDVARTLVSGGFHAVVVVDGDQLAGIATTTDLLRAALAADAR